MCNRLEVRTNPPTGARRSPPGAARFARSARTTRPCALRLAFLAAGAAGRRVRDRRPAELDRFACARVFLFSIAVDPKADSILQRCCSLRSVLIYLVQILRS